MARVASPSIFSGREICPVCGGSGRLPGWECGCGPGVKHFMPCGVPAPPCEECHGARTVEYDLSSPNRYAIDREVEVFLRNPGGGIVQLHVVRVELHSTFDPRQMVVKIEGYTTPADLAAVSPVVATGEGIDAGGVTPTIYLRCPVCKFISDDSHECPNWEKS